MLSIGSEVKRNPPFELVIQVRDGDGNPTGKTKSIITDSGLKLRQFWVKNNSLPKKKRKIVRAAAAHEVDEAVKEATGYVEKIRKAKKLED